jgi:hypothetical protein
MIGATEAAEKKINKYYQKLYTNTGSLYAFASILNPGVKLSYFDPKVCKLNFEVRNWENEFQEQFKTLYEEQYSSVRVTRKESYREVDLDPLALVLCQSRSSNANRDLTETYVNEADLYLEARKFLVIFLVIKC